MKYFVEIEELEKILKEYTQRTSTLFHVITLPKTDGKLTKEEHQILLIKAILEGEYDA